MNTLPVTVVADKSGRIMDWPGITAAGRSGRRIMPVDPGTLIPLPAGSRLYLLPDRRATGFSDGLIQKSDKRHCAVAAFLPPGYLALLLAPCIPAEDAMPLPLFCYCAVCWFRGGFHVPAVRIDRNPKHDPQLFDMKKVNAEITRRLKKHPGNRLMAHHGLNCVRKYGCPNAANLFLQRWEAPVAVSGRCNAACLGCISKQADGTVCAPQDRIGFTPTIDEILEIAVPHLEKAPGAIVSFGQGCEGEPLLEGNLLESAMREIRRRTKRGTIHVNTNGSLPEIVERLAAAGLDSIRISMNSTRPDLYSAYYNCRKYSFNDVLESFRIARKKGLWASVNYLTFPGVNDNRREITAFERFLRKYRPQMIQWRNLNIDPDLYMQTVDKTCSEECPESAGLKGLIARIRKEFPAIRQGYFNPPVRKA